MTTTPAAPAASQQAAVDAALLVLKSMGLSLEDLTAPGRRPTVPTFAAAWDTGRAGAACDGLAISSGPVPSSASAPVPSAS